MPRPTLIEDLERIESIIAAHPGGIRIADIEAEMMRRHGDAPNRRTLQRRLQKLIDARRLTTEGASIALVYRPIPGAAAPVHDITPAARLEIAEPEVYVRMSPEGADIRDRIRLPLMHRRHAAYQYDFLKSYIPGDTFYLPESLRRQLHIMGRTSAHERPAGTYARDILARLLIDLSWASSKLEGNTYSQLDTRNLIEFGQIAQGKDADKTQMILNHKAAIEMLVENADEIDFDPFTFLNLHAALSEHLMRDPEASGCLRWRPVGISGTVFHPLAVPQAVEDCFTLLLNKAAAIPDPFEQAFFLMVQLPYLQPFEDVNKRVSRIGANIPLFKHNLCPLSFIDVPERAYIEGTLGVYELCRIELLRDVFLWAYERSCQQYLAVSNTMAPADPFKIKYRIAQIQAVQAIVQGMRPPTEAVIEEVARDHAEAADLTAFTDMLRMTLKHLNEGRISRYRLRRAEYLAWRLAYPPS